jgi:predicted O-linked N-acetylglucosamine transferase (SPINDLY family)
MINVGEALATALRHHQAGRLHEAEPIYQQILQADPNHVDALHLLGVLANQKGDHSRAIASIARAIRLDGSQAAFHNNLGNALRSQGQLAEAIASYQRALQLRPNYPEGHNNLGLALAEQGQLAEAIASYQRALQHRPNFAEAHNNLGIALRSQGQLAEAVASYQRALQHRPNYAEAHNNLGNALRSQGQFAGAIAAYQRALELRPDYAEAHNNLGNALKEQGKLDEAGACYRRALIGTALTRMAMPDSRGGEPAMMTPAQALDLALTSHRAGDLRRAEQLYRHILQLDPRHFDALHLLGVVAHQAGRSDLAIESISQALRLKSDSAEAHNNLGAALMEQGRQEDAAACYRQALRISPDYAEAHNNLGNALMEQRKLDEAAACYRRALQRKPDYAEAHSNLGAARMEQGRQEEAVACYRQALCIRPDYAEAHYNLGNALKEQGQQEEAVACYRQALRIRPDYAEAHNNLGIALKEQGKLDDAAACYRRALQRKPDYAEAHYNLGLVLKEQGQREEAVACFRQALRIRPDYAEAHNNLGNTLMEQGKLDEAAASYRRALQQKPDYAEAHYNLGAALMEQGRQEDAAACYRQALRIRPDYAEAHNNLGNTLMEQGKVDEADACFRRALQRKPDYAEAHNNLGAALKEQGKLDEAVACYRRALQLKPTYEVALQNFLCALHYHVGVTLDTLSKAHADYQQRFAASLQSTWKPMQNHRDPERRLRLGFLSPDLHRHPVGFFLIRCLENLDRQQADVLCYSNSPINDDLTARIRAATTTWRDVVTWTDEALAEQIRADRIDILFDLAGHTRHNRLLVFARKPAPVQVTWAGYVGTTGLQAMDYILADRFEIPPEAEPYYCERVLRMPAAYVSYDPPAYAPVVSPLPALINGFVTFASFSNPAKLGLPTVEVWSRILHRLPSARLVLKYKGMDDPTLASRLAEMFQANGIDPIRVSFEGWSPHAELLGHYHRVDLGLDTFPYNGGLTTLEALWMGVPVITCPGETFASRHALTHLSNVGLPQMIARDRDDYVTLAVSQAGDLPGLAALRAGLREHVAASPLCDGKRFAVNFMQVLRDAWRHWCQEEPAADS